MQWQLIAVSVITSIVTTQASLQLFPRILGDWWMERIKKNYNKELEEFRDKLQQQQKAIQSLTDKALYVTRAQFDTEFAAIKEVSQRLGKVMLAFKKIHPLDACEELDEAELAQAVDALEEACSIFLDKLTEWAVFLEPNMFDEFGRCYDGAHEEWKRLSGHNQFHTDEAINVRHFTISYSNACQKVRDRIKMLAALPGPV
jgi:hypothetical protein